MASHMQPGDILLDAGTNELEVLVFRLDDGWFGVNVAKVREVIRPVHATESPHHHPSVVGMFNMRGSVIPLVDLRKHLGMESREGDASDHKHDDRRVIITEFNKMRTGFIVDGVEQIHRMSWTRIRPAPNLDGLAASYTQAVSVCTGVIDMDGRLVLMLDFESVADAIIMSEKLHMDQVANEVGADRASARVVLVEDSPFMRELIHTIFTQSGYDGIEVYSDGEEAWQAISAYPADGSATIDVVISDIEMPRMDGLHLTSRIKGYEHTAGVPVILFSSLITEDNLKKGQQVGADMQIAKPELAEIVRLVDKTLVGQLSEAQAA